MKFCWSTLNVRNLEESIKFYEEIIGLKVVRRFPAGPDTEIAFLGDGETKIELICSGNKTPEMGEDISWGFEVESLERTLSLVKERGAVILGEPICLNPQMRFAFIEDPNGMKIQLVENLG